MRRARATTPLAALVLVLAGCAGTQQGSADASRVDVAVTTESPRAGEELVPTVEVDGDAILVDVPDATWQLTLLDAGPVDLDDVAMFDGSATEAPSDGTHVVWVCMDATQLRGESGQWLSDAVRVEVWATDDGPRYDDLSGFDYEPAGRALDVYEASGNALNEPYERVCPIFVVPDDVDASTIAFVPNGGEPVVLER
ncbi:hypothetical protein [Agrococcus jejuensis]|uniref:Secreted protein n=1 Tax=Agrococcus jejuensis TaxID=399736 RepID=A0A1G8BAX9_9MICO|nr:hypothetical protein [Agrococcus jejuensis]SDH30402.1 hypothetical protein SAMN04489720_0834 [Agrococcus jejuensis]